jgi:tripartite-type tricarboxylate transporter receptor subunit TctC
MRAWLRVLVAVGGLLAAATAAPAQTYPAKPLTIVVPAAPGGVTDALGRMLAQRFTDAWGQQAIVENRPGANNQIAAEYVTKASPDGYTLFIGPETTFVVNPSLYAKLNYDPVKGFTPISGLVTINHALILHPSVPVQNVKELIALAKQKPGELNYGTFGIGTSGHLNIILMENMTGAKFTPVHYRGAAPGITDVIGGHIQMMIVSIGLVAQPWQAGQLKVLGLGSAARLPQYPDVPTLAESGLPGYEAGSWYALAAPKGTPREIVAKLNGETRRIFDDPGFRDKFLAPNFIYSIVSSPEAFAERIRLDSAKWGKVIRAANIKVE